MEDKLIKQIMMQALNENTSYTQDYIEGMEAGIKAAIQGKDAEIERLREGLEFYANKDTYSDADFVCDIEDDNYGDKAREILTTTNQKENNHA